MQSSSGYLPLEHVESMDIYVGIILREEILQFLGQPDCSKFIRVRMYAQERKHPKPIPITNGQLPGFMPPLQSLHKLASFFILKEHCLSEYLLTI